MAYRRADPRFRDSSRMYSQHRCATLAQSALAVLASRATIDNRGGDACLLEDGQHGARLIMLGEVHPAGHYLPRVTLRDHLWLAPDNSAKTGICGRARV